MLLEIDLVFARKEFQLNETLSPSEVIETITTHEARVHREFFTPRSKKQIDSDAVQGNEEGGIGQHVKDQMEEDNTEIVPLAVSPREEASQTQSPPVPWRSSKPIFMHSSRYSPSTKRKVEPKSVLPGPTKSVDLKAQGRRHQSLLYTTARPTSDKGIYVTNKDLDG